MDLDRIEKLLAKYWECETSVDEERELRAFFNSAEVPDKWKSHIPLFRYFKSQLKTDHLDELFDQKLLAKLEKKDKKGKVVTLFNTMLRVAAVILVVVTAGYLIREEYLLKKDTMDPYIAETFEDPKEAYLETKKALMLISKNMNLGKQEAKKIGVFHEASEKVKETEAL